MLRAKFTYAMLFGILLAVAILFPYWLSADDTDFGDIETNIDTRLGPLLEVTKEDLEIEKPAKAKDEEMNKSKKKKPKSNHLGRDKN